MARRVRQDLDGLARLVVGRRLIAVRRVFYVSPDGRVDTTDGPLELSLSDGVAVVLEGGSDGESLRWLGGSWTDPFQEPLDAVNRAFVAQHGKWSSFDMSELAPYDGLIGERIRALEPLTLASPLTDSLEAVVHDAVGDIPYDGGQTIGVRLRTDAHVIEARSTTYDEFVVDVCALRA